MLLTDCLSADGTVDCEPGNFQILEECFLRCPDSVPHRDDTHHEDDPNGVPGNGGGDSTQPHGGTGSGISGTAQELLDNLDQADADGDGFLSLTEAQTVNGGFTEEDFIIIDSNQDGLVSASELSAQLIAGEGSGDTEGEIEGNGEGAGDTEGDNTNPSFDFSCAAKASTVRLPRESIAGDLALLAIATAVLSRRRRKPVR